MLKRPSQERNFLQVRRSVEGGSSLIFPFSTSEYYILISSHTVRFFRRWRLACRSTGEAFDGDWQKRVAMKPFFNVSNPFTPQVCFFKP